MTAKEAYKIFKKKIPNLQTNIVEDWEIYFVIRNGKEGDMVDDDWKIDKKTSEFSAFDFNDRIEAMKNLPEDWIPTGYEI